MKKKRWFKLACLLLLLSIRGAAQGPIHGETRSAIRGETPDSFAWQANLDTVRQAAFYKITLTPGLVAKCRQDLPDLRISDANGQFIPYVLKSDLPVLSTD